MRRARRGFESPVVRRLLAEYGLDPAQIDGTGAGGRISRADVEAAAAARTSSPAEPPLPIQMVGGVAPTVAARAAEPPPESQGEPEPAPVTDAVSPHAGSNSETPVPFSAIRRRIAVNLRASIATAAHAFCAVEADFARVDRARRSFGDAWREREGFSLTYLPFVARAVVDALGEHPFLNASVTEEGLLVRHAVHLGIAVDLDYQGLIVPVIRDAARKRLVDIAREVVALAERARSGGLQPDEVVGGTFTITNPGPSGTFLSVPIINQPQVAILATDAVRRCPVMVRTADGGEGLVIHPIGVLGLSFDHRAVDGAYAASFVNRVKDLVESRDWAPEVVAKA